MPPMGNRGGIFVAVDGRGARTPPMYPDRANGRWRAVSVPWRGVRHAPSAPIGRPANTHPLVISANASFE